MKAHRRTEMNVLAYKDHGCIYFSNSNNDEKINQIIKDSGQEKYLESLVNKMAPDPITGIPLDNDIANDLWNNYMNEMIKILENAGCVIIWDDY
jgi:hypothetical protein